MAKTPGTSVNLALQRFSLEAALHRITKIAEKAHALTLKKGITDTRMMAEMTFALGLCYGEAHKALSGADIPPVKPYRVRVR